MNSNNRDEKLKATQILAAEMDLDAFEYRVMCPELAAEIEAAARDILARAIRDGKIGSDSDFFRLFDVKAALAGRDVDPTRVNMALQNLCPESVPMPITPEYFESRVGRPPQDDDLDRCNCPGPTHAKHVACGWCWQCDQPRFVCGCLRPADPARRSSDAR